MQRSDNDNHLKRVRFNAASVTVRESQVGDRFEDVAKKERIEAIRNMIELGLTEEKILTKYTKEEYEEAQKGNG